MSSENPIPTDDMKSKLRALETYMPNADRSVHRFGANLADYLNPRIFPVGFYMAADWLIRDLMRGVSTQGKQLVYDLTGQPTQFYAVLSLEIPEIADAVCPPEFAHGVREFAEQVIAELKK